MAPAPHPGAGPVRLRRRWRALLLSLAAFFAAALVLLYSESVLRWGVFLLTDVFVKPLSVAEVHGRLAGPFTLNGIVYADAERRLTLEQLTLDWRPSRLFLATTHVTRLQATGVSYVQQPGEAQPTPAKAEFTLPQISFPLKLILDEARIDGITLQLPAQTEPLTVTQLLLQAETTLNTLQLHTLQLHSDWLTLSLAGSLRPRQDYRTDLALEWRIPQQGQRPWQGQGTLRGNIRKLELRQRLGSPFIAELAVTASKLLEKLTWRGRLDIPKMESAQLPFAVSPAFSLGGVLQAQGDIDSFTATSSFAGQVETVGAVDGKLDAAYAGQRLELSRLLLTRQDDAARLEAGGELELATPLRYRMQAHWQSLTWPLETASVNSDSGRFNASGEESRYQFDGEFLLGGVQIPTGAWRLQGNGDSEAVTLSVLEGKLLDGTLTGEASLNRLPHLRWQAKLQGKALDPGVKWRQWPGDLSFAAAIAGQLPEQGLEMTLELPTLSGTLRGRELQGRSEAGWRHGVASLPLLELKSGSASLQAQGRMAEAVELSWQLNAPKLVDLLPQASGSLKADGRVSGPAATPRLALRMDGNALAFGNYQAAKLHTDIDLDLQEQAPGRATVQLDELRLPGFPLQSVALRAEGPLAEQRITLDSRSSQQSLNLVMDAGYAKGRWAGRITRLQIDDQNLGQWQLAQATAFSVMAEALSLDELCLNRTQASLCTSGQWKTESGLNASLRSARFPLQLLRPYLPQRIGIEGELDGRAMLALVRNQPPRLEADLRLGEGRFQLQNPEVENEALSLAFSGAGIQLTTSAAGTVDGKLSLALGERDRIGLDLQTSLAQGMPERLMQHPLKARLRASLRELGFVGGLIPEVQNPYGMVDVDVALAGSLASPQLSGHARIDSGRLDIPRMGLKLSALQLTATGDNSRQMAMAGFARSGDGELTLSGQLVPTTKGAWTVDLAMVGKDFEVARIPEARMAVSPNLTARIVGREIHLEGDLDIPDARLEPPDISLAVKPSDDVVLIGAEEAEAEREVWRIYTRVRLTAADSIRFIGYGFDGRIGGDLLLIDEPGSVSRARGELHVVPGSTYKAFGQKLNTDRGQLNFADSPVDNPNLDIRATRTIGEVVAGIDVRGTAQTPVFSLFSEPPMDQADILSYLTLGHPMNTAGAGEGEALAGAANTAGLVGGNYLAGYIGRQFGLEEARVEAGPDTQSPWLVVGKYLSPRLYVRYGVGVYEEAYSFIVRYTLTEHWQVQGEGGRNSGADIFYTFERP